MLQMLMLFKFKVHDSLNTSEPESPKAQVQGHVRPSSSDEGGNEYAQFAQNR